MGNANCIQLHKNRLATRKLPETLYFFTVLLMGSGSLVNSCKDAAPDFIKIT